MTITLTEGAPVLRDALYALSLSKQIPDANLLDDVVRRYPQFRDQLTECAIDIALEALRGDAAVDAAEASLDPTVTSPAVTRAMSRFQNRLHAETAGRDSIAGAARQSGLYQPINPFENLSREEFRAVAHRLDVNNVFLAKLRDRQIEPDTMTPGFQRRVAEEMSVPLEVMLVHFEGPQSGAMYPQFFKAEGKPTDGGRQTFAEAVRSSGLSETQQRNLLEL